MMKPAVIVAIITGLISLIGFSHVALKDDITELRKWDREDSQRLTRIETMVRQIKETLGDH